VNYGSYNEFIDADVTVSVCKHQTEL